MSEPIKTQAFSPNFRALELCSEDDFHSDEQLLAFLTEKIKLLLQHDSERLLQILYRLDVREEKVSHIFRTEEMHHWSSSLAIIVLEREKERLFWRKKYSGTLID